MCSSPSVVSSTAASECAGSEGESQRHSPTCVMRGLIEWDQPTLIIALPTSAQYNVQNTLALCNREVTHMILISSNVL